jgi:hypothetical protein
MNYPHNFLVLIKKSLRDVQVKEKKLSKGMSKGMTAKYVGTGGALPYYHG